MNTKSKKNVIAGLLLLVCMIACIAIATAIMPTVVYAESASPYLQVTCGSIDKSGAGWTWDTDESYNGTLTLNGYDGEEIAIGGVDNGKVDIVLVGDNKITVTAPYGNRAIHTYNVSTLTFKGNGSLTIDYQVVASNRVNMHGILMEGEGSSKNNGNLTFDESCTVTVKVYGEVAAKNGSVDAIYMKTDDIGSGNVTVGENATLNIDLKCDKDYQTYGIFAKGNVALNGTVDIRMEYTGSGSTYDTWRDVNTSSSYSDCSIEKNATITSVCPGSNGSSLIAFPLVANGGKNISSWTYIGSSEQYFENDDCLVHVWDKCANGVSFKNYSYNKIAPPLTFEDKAEYDVPSTVYGGDVAYSSIALSASGGSGEYSFSIVSAADGNRNGVGISSNESDFNKIYVNPNIRGVSEATEITVRVKDKGGYSKDVTVRIGEVAAPTYSATVDPVDFGTVRVGYSPVTQVPLRVVNTGTGKINCNLTSITLEGENASSFTLGYYSSPYYVGAGAENTSSWSIKPNNGLPVGTYTATIKFSGTPEYSKYGGSSVEATATVRFVVTEHDFDTTTWQYDNNTHWNPCKDTGCAVHGNEAAHDTKGELKNATAATFDTNGYTGDKYCSVCGALAEEGTVIPAGKYIRVSQATMTPAAITDKMTANDLDKLFFTGNVFYESDDLKEKFAHYSTYYRRNGIYQGVYTGPQYMEETVREDDFYPNPTMQMTSYRFLEKHGIKFYEGIIHEDNLFTLSCLLCADRVSYLDRALYNRRIRSDSIMTKPARPENVIGYFRSGEQALSLSGMESITCEQRAAFFAVVDSWFSAAADYFSVLSETDRLCVLDSLGPCAELLFRQTVQLRVSGREALSRASEEVRGKGFADGYEQARTEFLGSRSYRIGRVVTAVPRRLLRR